MAAGNTYTQIASTTVSSSTASITFSSIPGSYTDLELILAMNNVGSTSQVSFNLNGSSTGYSRVSLFGTGSAVQSVQGLSQTVGYFAISNDPSGNGAIIKASFLNYANTSVAKTILSRWSSTAVYVTADVNLWQNTAAIDTLLINAVVNNFPAGTTASLYGISAA